MYKQAPPERQMPISKIMKTSKSSRARLPAPQIMWPVVPTKLVLLQAAARFEDPPGDWVATPARHYLPLHRTRYQKNAYTHTHTHIPKSHWRVGQGADPAATRGVSEAEELLDRPAVCQGWN